MRLLSLLLGLALLPLLVVVLALSPLIVPLAFVAAILLPGFVILQRTSDKFTWNLASYHSPHSLTWRWCLSLIAPRAKDEGRWLGFWYSAHNSGAQAHFQLARHCLTLSTQRPMWFRDLYQRARDDRDGLSAGGVYQVNASTEARALH